MVMAVGTAAYDTADALHFPWLLMQLHILSRVKGPVMDFIKIKELHIPGATSTPTSQNKDSSSRKPLPPPSWRSGKVEKTKRGSFRTDGTLDVEAPAGSRVPDGGVAAAVHNDDIVSPMRVPLRGTLPRPKPLQREEDHDQDLNNTSSGWRVGSDGSKGRTLLQCDGCAGGGVGLSAAPNLAVLVVRPQLPSGCSPTNALVGGCDALVRCGWRRQCHIRMPQWNAQRSVFHEQDNAFTIAST